MAVQGGGKLYQFGPMAGAYVWVDFNPGKIIAVIDATIHARMETAMKLAMNTAKDNMQDMSPSAEGDMPGIDSGTLKANIEYKIIDSATEIVGAFGVFKASAPNEHTGEVVDLIYALYLETGTGAPYNMNPRPWLTLTVAEVWDQWQSIFSIGGSGFSDTASSSFSMGQREEWTALGGRFK